MVGDRTARQGRDPAGGRAADLVRRPRRHRLAQGEVRPGVVPDSRPRPRGLRRGRLRPRRRPPGRAGARRGALRLRRGVPRHRARPRPGGVAGRDLVGAGTGWPAVPGGARPSVLLRRLAERAPTSRTSSPPTSSGTPGPHRGRSSTSPSTTPPSTSRRRGGARCPTTPGEPVSSVYRRTLDYSCTDEYFDVHVWTFSPPSFEMILNALGAMELTDLRIEALVETPAGGGEFTPGWPSGSAPAPSAPSSSASATRSSTRSKPSGRRSGPSSPPEVASGEPSTTRCRACSGPGPSLAEV